MVLQVGHMPHEVHHTGRADLGRGGAWCLPRKVERPSEEDLPPGRVPSQPLWASCSRQTPLCPETSRGEGMVCQGVVTAPGCAGTSLSSYHKCVTLELIQFVPFSLNT